jgi:hypothetical protein
MHQQVEYFNNCTLCPHCIYMFFIYPRTNSDLCHLHKKLICFYNWDESVYSAVRTEPLNETVCALSLRFKKNPLDRWIQKELALTPAKNATTPNPFKIIPLQSARKENSWETEETPAGAAITLETERAKWPNPWCLWWWRILQLPRWFPIRTSASVLPFRITLQLIMATEWLSRFHHKVHSVRSGTAISTCRQPLLKTAPPLTVRLIN